MIDLFPTKIVYVDNCNLNLENLERKCMDHMATEPSSSISNIGGYQGHHFSDNQLFTTIKRNILSFQDEPIKKFNYVSWVNVNGPGSYNERHSHDPHSGTFLSGVFYVKCPEGSGRIRFYDPRPHIQSAADMKYYNRSDTYHWFPPIPNTMIMFPSWLEHDVEINRSTEERISISFNIINVEY
jgi:uncharacterized protein (TIGR02466 family)